jgi:hypothetical protein
MRLIRSSLNEIIAEMKDKRDKTVQSRSVLGDIPSALVEKRALFRSVKAEFYKTIGPIVLGGHIRGHHSSYEMKPSAEFHLSSKAFMTKLNASRLANVSEVTVGVKVIALVNDKEVHDEVCYIAKGKVYLKTQTEESGIDSMPFSSTGRPGHVFVFDDEFVGIERENGTADKLLPISNVMVRRDAEWIRKLIVESQPYKLPIIQKSSRGSSLITFTKTGSSE